MMAHFPYRRLLWTGCLVALALVTFPALADDKSADQSRAVGVEGKIMQLRPDAQELMIQTKDGQNLMIEAPKDQTWVEVGNNAFSKLNELKVGETVSVIYYKENGKNRAALVAEGTGGAGTGPSSR